MSLTVTVLTACCVVVFAFLVSLARTVVLGPTSESPRGSTARGRKVCVVLGSGGHTSEMLRTINALPRTHWGRHSVTYVVSSTDHHSAQLAEQLEVGQRCSGATDIVHRIPRAREVGQSYATSVFSTLKAAAVSLKVVNAERPEVLLTNGPGVCVPVVLAAVLLSACLPWSYRRPTIVYLESFTCVRHVSFTGRLLAPYLTDVFTVQWRALEAKVKGLMRRGQLFYVGAEQSTLGSAVAHSHPFIPAVAGGGYAVVTVGSTRFDALVEALVCDGDALPCLQKLGIHKLYVQHGTGPTPVPAPALLTGGVTVEAFGYRPNLAELIREAALVVTHAGAGTILECLQSHRRSVVVPNRQLMSDHQLELAEVLQDEGYVYCVAVEDLAAQLPALDFGHLRVYPGMNHDVLASALGPSLGGGMLGTR